MFSKLYEKSQVWFAVLFIIVYVVANSILLQVSDDFGYEMLFTIPANLLILVVLLIFINKKGLSEYYGLCKVKTKAKSLLFYLPLIIVGTVNIWLGVCLKMDPLRTVIYFVAMVFTGVVEEMLFRGLLFQAMGRKNIKSAIIVTSILFGAGHIVNLFNGNSETYIDTITQIFYAVAVGFLLAAVLYVGKSIIPCMIFHAMFNALSSFSNEAAFEKIQIPVSIALCVISGVSAFVIFKLNKNGK